MQDMQNGDSPQEVNQVGDTEDPSKFLGDIIGAPVVVKLNSDIVFRGTLQSVDGYMNISLERCREVDHNNKVVRDYGEAFVRGNNVIYICLDDGSV
ncbi:U6 snRNA-associated Sm-like protein LSm6 [Polyplosphaeria fusca]|uniref:U6 snRNA-associated Sm-like protein LSm6 n=1 Tax=Polyplosphaeria fusca TaxID=682080 RepID=A0A9P4QYV6_9PLEO|nr:U6 snRNA-associated Sm-like protein LSm6 [Polyplosphaeria fusca]